MELELVLTDAGYDVVGRAMDAAGALAIADRERPELALVDLNLLDGLTGPQISETLVRNYGATVVFLTANPEQIPEGFAGALGVLSKPFDDQTLCAVVDFARKYIATQAVDQLPRRFRLAPWLLSQPEDVASH